MSDSEKELFGRINSMNWLRRQIVGAGVGNGLSRILLMHGSEGIGKTALVDRFLEEYTGVDGGLKSGNFVWKVPPRPASLGLFVQLLLGRAETNVMELQERLDCLQVKVRAPAVAVGVEEEGVLAGTYDSHGTSRNPAANFNAIGSVEEEELAKGVLSALGQWLDSGKIISEQRLESVFRLIFVFDAFDSYPVLIKNWLGRYFFPAVRDDDSLPPIAIILTGRHSWEDGGQADYWEAHPGCFSQYSLEPLSRHDCEEWLQSRNMRLSLVDMLHEETEGNPARIERVLKDPDFLERLDSKKGDPADALSYFNAQERRWLHAAVMSRAVTLEMLQILLGRVEGIQAYGWLSKHIEFCQVERDYEGENLLVLSKEMREFVMDRSVKKVPARHREFRDKMELLGDIRIKVTSLLHRENLRLLSPVQPFNDSLITEVFKPDG